VQNIRTAYRARIAGLTWMSPQTRAKAQAKLAALKVGLGYPDSWIDYSGLVVVRGDASGNLRRAEAFAWRRGLAKLRQPVDPAEWPEPLLKPQMVGAIINFTPNALQFAAGVLQPPYFDYAGDAAANYGSAGAGIGHEITHSFDELGNLYDAQGLLVRWWTAEDLTRFQAATAPMAAQLDAYCPKPGLCVKGKQVLIESTDDLAGLMVAHDAYVLSLNGKPDAVKDGLTGDQRFFLAFARRWRRLQTDAALSQQIATDTHAPGETRSDTVRNLEAWRRAFDVQPGDKLYLKPEARVRIW
jgi:putative endopeptidase